MFTDFLIRVFCIPKEKRGKSNTPSRTACGILAGTVGIVCNLLLFAAKFAVGLVSGNVAVTADAFNSFSDAGASAVTLIGFHMSGRPADKKHPFGHGRIEYIAGLAVSVLVLTVGLEFFKASVLRILHPAVQHFSWLAFSVLLASIAVKLMLGLFHRRIGQRIDSDTMKAAALDAVSDCAATAVTAVSLVVSRFTDFPVDGIAGIAVSCMILAAGFSVLRGMLDDLLGPAPDPALVARLRAKVLSYPGIAGIHDLIIHNYGPGRTLASLHAEVDERGDIRVIHETIDRVERETAAELGIFLVIHTDPLALSDPETIRLQSVVMRAVRSVDPALSIHDFRMVRGTERSNLIFDLVVPQDYSAARRVETEDLIRQVVARSEPSCQLVIQTESSFI